MKKVLLALTVLSTPAMAQDVAPSAPSPSEQSEMVLAVRAATRSTSAFEVTYSRRLTGAGDGVAFVELIPTDGDDARSHRGWAVVERRAGRWVFVVGVAYRGRTMCSSMENGYRMAVSRYGLALIRLRIHRDDDELFPLSFYTKFRRALVAGPTESCFGEVIAADLETGEIVRSLPAPPDE